MAFLTATANKVLDSILKNTDYVQAAALFVSIHSADPGGTGASEITGYTGTDRPAVTFNAASAKVSTNDATDIDYLVMPAVTVTHGGLVDQAAHAGGTWWWDGALAASRVVAAGDTFRFPASTGITVTLT